MVVVRNSPIGRMEKVEGRNGLGMADSLYKAGEVV